MDAHTVPCPHCGLPLTIKRVKDGTRISYDPGEWRRLCRYPDLDSPTLCLIRGSGSDIGSGRGPVTDP